MYKHFGYVRYSKGRKRHLAGSIHARGRCTLCMDGEQYHTVHGQAREPLMAAVAVQAWGVRMMRWRWWSCPGDGSVGRGSSYSI